jgi:hypothetical protein
MMGTVYKYKNKFKVQIRHRGYPSVSCVFEKEEEARGFERRMERLALRRMKIDKLRKMREVFEIKEGE